MENRSHKEKAELVAGERVKVYMNKRQLNLKKYGISEKRYKELCGFCEQYPEWLDELKYKTDTMKSAVLTDLPRSSSGVSDRTAVLAIHRTELQKKCELIEQTAIQASADLSSYIIKSVCFEMPVSYLQASCGMACSVAAFYDARRYFFYLLHEKKKM